MKRFDLIVLGTGPAGSTVAKKIADTGKKIAILESRQFGGTCALRGCNPKKVYTNAAGLLDQVRRADGKLTVGQGVSVDWSRLLEFKQEFTKPVLDKSKKSFQKKGIETFLGQATFENANTLRLNGELLTADKILIATGAHPRPLSFPGKEHVILSDQFLELTIIPKRIVFIGGGYVSMEFAHVAAIHGCYVTVIQRSSSILKEFDPTLSDMLMKHSMEHLSMNIQLDREVVGIEKGDSLIVQLDQGNSIPCDLVVHGAGRVPNIDDLNLEKAEVKFSKRGISVNSFMQSPSNEHVFAAGDCAESAVPRLTPVANEQARIIVNNLFNEDPTELPNYGAIPKVAFTTPAIAGVGLTEEEATEKGHHFKVNFEETSSWNSVRKTGGTVAGYKILIDKKSNLILGAHLLGPGAEETINLFALAMKFNLTAKDIKSTLFTFPTFASDVRQMI